MRSSAPLCFLAVCLLRPAFAFVSPSGGIVSSHARRGTPSSCTSRTRAVSPIVMQAGGSAAEAAVERYKKYVGPQRWSGEEGLAEKATGVFEEISSVYGEENAAEIVRAWMLSVGLCTSICAVFFLVAHDEHEHELYSCWMRRCCHSRAIVFPHSTVVVLYYIALLCLAGLSLCICVAPAARGGEGVCVLEVGRCCAIYSKSSTNGVRLYYPYL